MLKDLPDFIKESVTAYVGCVAGAMIKDEYLKVIQQAGFHEVEIKDEAVFSIGSIFNDPTVETVINKIELTVEKMEDAINSVVSIKVQGMKPE